jgi:hypothetical protein
MLRLSAGLIKKSLPRSRGSGKTYADSRKNCFQTLSGNQRQIPRYALQVYFNPASLDLGGLVAVLLRDGSRWQFREEFSADGV